MTTWKLTLELVDILIPPSTRRRLMLFSLLTVIAAILMLMWASGAQAQTATPTNIRCWNGSAWVSCPLSDGGAGAVTANTSRVTLGGEPCSGTKTNAPFSINTATTTQIIAASTNNKVYICSINVGPISTANNVAVVEDDTAACSSPTAGLFGGTTAATGWQFPASGGLVNNGGNASIAVTAAANRYVCIITSSTSQTSGNIMYVLAP